MKRLLHWWRLLVEPSGDGRLLALSPKRWQVVYADGKSVPLAYDTACAYASMFGGEVVRFRRGD